jgi:hypothetical protein
VRRPPPPPLRARATHSDCNAFILRRDGTCYGCLTTRDVKEAGAKNTAARICHSRARALTKRRIVVFFLGGSLFFAARTDAFQLLSALAERHEAQHDALAPDALPRATTLLRARKNTHTVAQMPSLTHICIL